jgi:Acetyltransferase (GNAT) domain
MTAGNGRPTVISPVPRAAWEGAVRADADAVVSQSLAWRDAVFADGHYRDASRLYEFGSGRRVVLPLARPRRKPPWAVASWPAVWGVGGPIGGGQISPAEAAAILRDVAGRGTLSARIQLRHGADHSWLAGAAGFQVEQHACHVLDLAGGFGEVWSGRFRGTARTAIRKAERADLDIEVDRSGRLLPAFGELYEKSIHRWAAMQHEPPWLTRWRTVRATSPGMLALVARQFGDNCAVWLARSAGVPVAAIIVLRSGSYAKYWRGAMDKTLANQVRANEYLHRLAIEDACQDGYRWYDMGTSRPGSSLAQFKEKLGATQQASHTLRVERLPVSSASRGARDLVKKAIGFRDV